MISKTDMTHSGLFWTPEPKKIKEKAVKPHPFWLEDGYMPPYDFTEFEEMSESEIRKGGDTLVCDIELYPNYFLAAFMSLTTGKVINIESELDKLNYILHKFKIITFNGNHFDVPIMTLAIAGHSIDELKYAADMLIVHGNKGWQVLQSFKVDQLDIDHIDIIEVCPLKASLKIYGGRLHAPRMQDLPFPPETELSDDQKAVVKNYCLNDLTTTAIVYSELSEQIQLREGMSAKYGIDLRSRSDAQVAEAVFKVELKKMGTTAKKTTILPGTAVRYKAPSFVSFTTDSMKALLNDIERARFSITEKGSLFIPDELVEADCRKFVDPKKRKGRKVLIGKGEYRMGIGGLHSCEEKVSYLSDDKFIVVDRDVASYYPALILNQNLFPKHLGPNFLNVYRSVVSRRLAAKKANNKIEADSLKITINGVFGKLGSRYSIFYSPDLLIQTTITGQLSLLMLIERLELNGIHVCSANTDGIVVRYPRVMKDKVDSVFSEWEKQTNFETEETTYDAIYLANVNNYIAVKPDRKVKTKGAYSNPWGEKGMEIFRFHKNPTNSVSVEAAVAYLTDGVPVRDTIRSCRDFEKFLTVRAVKGGAVKNDQYLGKAIRWYWSNNTPGDIIYASNGNKVPKSENSQPCMELPEEFPDDVDYSRYEIEALTILKDIAAI